MSVVHRGTLLSSAIKWILLVAICAELIPMVFGVLAGRLFPVSASPIVGLKWNELLLHNLRIGLLIVVVGWLSAGVGAVLFSGFGAYVGGLMIGQSIGLRGLADTALMMRHFPLEVTAFVFFTACGLCGGWLAILTSRSLLTRGMFWNPGISSVVFLIVGIVLLVGASFIESAIILQ